MLDPLDAYRQLITCPFCQSKFNGTVKLIPDCGKCICQSCLEHLIESLEESKSYECKACGESHILPERELPSCTLLVDTLRHPVEKPLSEQSKKLKHLVEIVQEELAKLRSFDPRDHIEQQCVQLELEVSQASISAVNRIKEIEADLHKQIQADRQRCLDGLQARTSKSTTEIELEVLHKEINEFSVKWNDYFKRLNSLASERELEAAIYQTNLYQGRMRKLDQETKNLALNESLMKFNPRTSFQSASDHLGELVETAAHVGERKSKG